ncbi:hypothetical protein ACFWDI_28155 [Streptomyces sp. NPDC060064]|uniref:hypothetical protein n=1 Tax=Streptomyces sp. NPDC060064 TaxID=3347049 RepID=UPI00368ABFDD
MSLTLADLRQQLAAFDDLPGDTPVVMSKDGEGNGYSPLAELSPGMYLAENTWSGEHYPTEEQLRDDPNADEDEGAPEDAVPAVFLWPVN